LAKEKVMYVKVSEIDGGFASTPQAGERLYNLIAPVLARGEEVVLDFEGVRYTAVPFFMASIQPLIEADREERLSKLLRYENLNLTPFGQSDVEAVTEFAVRCRDPRVKAAYAAAAQKLAERD
jgi:hypothetical protein